MCKETWKENLLMLMDNSGYSDIEMYAWTNIPVATISNMSNKKHQYLTCEQFLLFKLLFKETHVGLLIKLFGKDYFKEINKVEPTEKLTRLGSYFRNKYSYEKFQKKKIIDVTAIKSSRIDYIFENSDDNVRIDEITRLEKASGEAIGNISNILFPNISLNSPEDFENLLSKQREVNKLANIRRNKKN